MSMIPFARNEKYCKFLSVLLIIAFMGGYFQPLKPAAANSKVKIIVIANSESYFPSMGSAYEELLRQGYPLEIRIFSGSKLADSRELTRLQEEVKDAQIMLLQMIGIDTTRALEAVMDSIPADTKIMATKSVEFPTMPRIDNSESEVLAAYFDEAGVENMRRLFLYLAANHGGLLVEEDYEVLPVPGMFIYHPEAKDIFVERQDYLAWYEAHGKVREDAPWIGILAGDSFFKNDDIDMYTSVLEELENSDVNVILAFAKDRESAARSFFMENENSAINLLISATGFNFVYGNPEQGVELFEQLNIPVLAPVYSSALESWELETAGLSSEVYWQIAMPEIDGRIEPIMMGGSKTIGVDPKTGVEIEKKVPIPDRIKRIANRAINWTGLQQKPNIDKKIALLYYNYGGGKDGITASYLNVERSTAAILEALVADGYQVDGEYPTQELLEMMLGQGRNVGSWAPGEMEKLIAAGAMILPVEDYLQWFRELPPDLQQAVEEDWGPPPGKVMVYDGDLIIPGMILGNVFVGPQPMRAWDDDPEKIAHSPELTPNHQYLAFYFWLRNSFGADAVIHLGTHGTQEWLPGRSVGLGADDWPDVVLGDMPNIYPYIVINPGEGTQAKRRGYAVIIDHLTPPMIKPELYGSLSTLEELLSNYDLEKSRGNPERLAQVQKQIIENARTNNLEHVLNLELNQVDFDKVVEDLENYLADLLNELMPYGLHTFGSPPEGELLEKMAESMVAYDPETREGSRQDYQEKLAMTTREMDNLLRALRGEYIVPGLSRDPVRIPDSLPTGANFYSFDPRLVPDKAAWETGKKSADLLLEQHLAEKGRYPERVGVVLWAIETMRTQGESIAMIMRLAGLEPEWDKSGRVTGVVVTPLEELGRPRIDVVVTISGLFRDTFSYMLEVMDRALTQAAELEESPEDNLLRKHSEQDLQAYLTEGLSPEEAKALSLARIFGEPPGTYGVGVSDLVEATTAWENSADLVEPYFNRMSFIYGAGVYGKEGSKAFQRVLSNTEVTVQVRDSLYGVLDNDDVYQYLGGLTLAAGHFSGRDVSAYVANTRRAREPEVKSFVQFMDTELRTRVLNPIWIEGMLEEGYSGAATISKHVAHLFGVDATLNAVDEWAWNQVMETIALDLEVADRLTPYAVQAITGWGLEAARREMWQADPETVSRLADTYIESVLEYGVVCCHHTCANVVFNEWLASFSTLPANAIEQFAKVFREATEQSLTIKPVSATAVEITPAPAPARFELELSFPVSQAATMRTMPTTIVEETEAVTQPAEAGEEITEEEQEAEESRPKAYEIHPVEEGNATGTSGVTFWALLGAALLGLLIAVSYFRYGRKMQG